MCANNSRVYVCVCVYVRADLEAGIRSKREFGRESHCAYLSYRRDDDADVEWERE